MPETTEKAEKIPEPNFRTKPEDFCGVEKIKIESQGLRVPLAEEIRDTSTTDIGHAAEALAKSHGMYLEYNRAKTGREKDWMFMVRVSIPGGGVFNADLWRIFDDVASQHAVNPEGKPSIRLTTRQNVQYHWIKKPSVLPLVQAIAKTRYYTLNGCGDNFRNVMACPLSRFSNVFNGHAIAQDVAAYFRLPAEPYIEIFGIDSSYIRTPDEHFDYAPNLLNRKFKTAFSAVHQDEETGAWKYDNCVELRTNEIGIAPVMDEKSGRVDRVMLYIGGGQGEKNGKPTMAALGVPFGVVPVANIIPAMDAITKVHMEWGDRQHRHWARMKYVIWKQGVKWYRDRVREHGIDFELPIEGFDPGPRDLHHGWHKQPSNGKWAFGCYIENGRLIDGPNGNLKTMVMQTLEQFKGVELVVTPNQDILFTNVEADAREDFEAALKSHGWGQRNGKAYSTLRLNSGACVGLHTCRLAYTESEQFEPELLDQLDEMGHGDVNDSIGITGCERQCFRPATKTIGWVGQGPDLYELKVGGSEDGSTQGHAVIDDGKWYLRQIQRTEVANVIAALFDFYKTNRKDGETMGQYHRRIGLSAIVAYMKTAPRVAPHMERTWPPPFVPEDQHF